jgi:hypothetical protein
MNVRNRVVALLFLTTGWVLASANDSTSLNFQPWGTAGLYASKYSVPRGGEPWYDFSNSAPRGGAGLNILALGVTAESPGIFGAVTLHYGDVPNSGWDQHLPWLQEAWVGYHINEQFDISAGAFVSPIGVETPNGFENYSGIMSISYFFDPACQSGVQLAWNAASDVVLSGGVVSSFSSYSLSAEIPSLIAMVEYTPDEDLYMSQILMSKEESDSGQYYQVYTSMSGTAHYGKTHAQAEIDVACTVPTSSASASALITGIAAVYYDVVEQLQMGVRVEAVYDPDGIFTYMRIVDVLPANTLAAAGATATVTYQPTEWGKLRLDARYLGSLDVNSLIGVNPNARDRTEVVLCADVLLSFLGNN